MRGSSGGDSVSVRVSGRVGVIGSGSGRVRVSGREWQW